MSSTISFTIGYQGPASAQVANAQTLSAQAQPAQASQTTTPNIQANWFTYDADGRVLVANGSLENGQIVITSGLNSGQNTYDAAGDLASYTTINASGQTTTQRGVYNVQGEETLLQTQTTTGGSYAAYESKSYDADGHLISTVTYQLPGSLEAGVYNGAPVSFSDAGWIKSDLIETYNADGEVIDQSEYDEDSAQDLINAYGTGVATSAYASQDQSAPGSLPSVGSSTDGALYLSTDYSYASGSGLGYDKDGNLLGYVVITSGHNTVVNPSASATTTTYQNQYVWQNNALNSSTTATGSGGTTSNTNTYNDLGELVETSGTLNGTAQTNALAYTADAQVLQKTISSDGTTTFSTFMYANEQGLGSVNNQGVINILATTGGFTNSQLGTQSYTVATGDTLQSLAQKIYGDSNYSYILAEANGLQANSPLTVGLSLKIPQVTTTANTATTFQPYAQSAIVNGSSSACLTTAQIVVTSIQAVLNQQSAFAQTVQNVEQAYQAQEQQLQAIATAQAAQAAAAAKEAQADQALQLAQKEQVADHILDQGDVTEKRNETALLHGIGVLGDGLIWGQISDGSDYATDVGGGAFGGGGGDDDGILPINLGPGDILGEENLTPDESYGAQEIDQLESIDNEAAAIEDSANSAYDRQLAAYDSAEDDYNEGEANLASADAEQSSAGSPNDVDTLSTAVGGPAFTAYTNWYGNLSVSGATGGEDGVGEADWVASQTGIEPTSWAGLAGGDASSGIFDGGGTGEGGFGNALGNAAIAGMNSPSAAQQSQQYDFTKLGQGTGSDGVQTFALQDGVVGNGDGLPGPFIDVSNAPAAASTSLSDLRAQLETLQSRVADGSISTEEFNQEAGNINGALDGILSSTSQSSGAGRPSGYDENGSLNVNIYGGRQDVLTGTVQGMAGTLINPGAGTTEGGWGTTVADGVHNVLTGALVGSMNMVYQPIAQVHDLLAVAGGAAYAGVSNLFGLNNEPYQPNYWSSTGQQAATDNDPWDHTGQNLLSSNPITGLPYGAYTAYQSIKAGDYASVEQQAGGLLAMGLMGKAGGTLTGEMSGMSGPRIDPTITLDVPSTTVDTAASDIHPDILAAQQDQINSGYNPDNWTMTTLPKGSLVYGGLPGQSAYYTTEQTLLDGNFDSATVFDSLQVAAHPVFGYRPEMGVYQVLEDTQIPTGQALANPGIGSGGAQQFFFGNYGTQLQLVNRIPLGK